MLTTMRTKTHESPDNSLRNTSPHRHPITTLHDRAHMSTYHTVHAQSSLTQSQRPSHTSLTPTLSQGSRSARLVLNVALLELEEVGVVRRRRILPCRSCELLCPRPHGDVRYADVWHACEAVARQRRDRENPNAPRLAGCKLVQGRRRLLSV